MGIYPKKKKVLKAASGMNTEDIDNVDSAITKGAALIPGDGPIISGALSIGSALGKSITGNGTSGVKNAIGDAINPLSTVNSLLSGHAEEAIPIVGGFLKANRTKNDMHNAQQDKMMKDSVEQNRKVAGSIERQQQNTTYKEGGEIDSSSEQGKSSDKAVVLGGELHKDGGNPIVDENGEKHAETEREELMLNHKQTTEIESLIGSFQKSQSEDDLLKIGLAMHRIVHHETKDNSKKYDL